MKKMFIIIFILLMGTGSAAGCIKQEPAKQGDSEGKNPGRNHGLSCCEFKRCYGRY